MHPSAARSGAIGSPSQSLLPRSVVSGVGWIASAPVAAASNAVIDWNAVAGRSRSRRACLAPANDPLHEARMLYTLAHVAVHDALQHRSTNATEPYAYDAQAACRRPRLRPPLGSCGARHAGSGSSAICRASCSHRLVGPTVSRVVDAALDTATLAAIPDGDAKTDGI